MADVLMVYPKTGFDVPGGSVDLPMSVICASTQVSKQFDVKILDQRIDKNFVDHLFEELLKKPICVGISCMTGPQIESAIDIAFMVKYYTDRKVPVVFGGVHPTLFPEQTLKHKDVDFVVKGEGEKSFLSLVRYLNDPVEHQTKRIFESSIYCDLERMPPPPIHLVDVEKYIGDQGRMRDENVRALIFFGSRGCPYHCGYCSNEEIHHGSYRTMSAELIYSRSMEMVRKYNLNAIMYHDEDLFLRKARVHRLAELIDGQFTWYAQVRMDSMLNVDLKALYDGGLRYIQAGIESGSPHVLKMINKGETVQTMIEANRYVANTPIKPLYNFMMGFPGEKKQDVYRTIDLAMQLLDENPNAEMTGIYSYVPYPGTALYRKSLENGFEPPNSISGWSRFTRQGMNIPWMQQDKDFYHSVMTMSKFIDGTRMVRRLKRNSKAGWFTVLILKALTKLFRHRWRNLQFDKMIEIRLTNWIEKKFFNW